MTTETNPKPSSWRPIITPELATNILILLTIITLYLQLQVAEKSDIQEIRDSNASSLQEIRDSNVSSLQEIRVQSAADLKEIRALIQVSESNRQADTRAINARVDVVEQLVVAARHIIAPRSADPVLARGGSKVDIIAPRWPFVITHGADRNKVFRKMARWGPVPWVMGWFFGLKLYLVINSRCQIIALRITTAPTLGSTGYWPPGQDIQR